MDEKKGTDFLVYGRWSTGMSVICTHLGASLAFGGQLCDVLVVQAEEVENVYEALAIDAGWGFELDLGLGAPGDAEACGVKHKKIIGAVADGDRL